MIKALVAAPSLALRAGLRLLLTSDEEIDVVGETAAFPVSRRGGLPVDVLVAAGFDPDAAEVFLDAANEDPSPEGAHPALLLLVENPPDLHFLQGLSGWRLWGLLPVDCSAEELLAAVKALHQGLLVSDPLLLSPYLYAAKEASGEQGSAISAPGTLPIDALTEREAQVLQHIAQGLANKQIAAALGISEHTVKFHVSAIFSKLGANSRTEAVRLGVRQGLIVL